MTGLVSAFCLPLKVDQSVLDNKPFCEPLAVAIAIVIVPLVVIGVEPIVTPLVAEDKPTEVTVPRLEVLLLKVVQSDELKAPLFVALAVGKLKVWVSVALEIAKSVPLVPTAKNCTWFVNPFNAVKPVVNVVITWHKWLFSVCSVIVRPDVLT